MSLTEPALLIALALLTVGVFAWNVVAWPRSAGRGVLAVLRRIARQLAVMALVLITVGVALNDQYDWYANWADLTTSFSATAPAGTIVAAGDGANRAANAVVAPTSPNVLAARPGGARAPELVPAAGPNGQYRQYTVNGPTSGFTGTIMVWFPAAYTDPAQRQRLFPVLETFHGIPGTPAQWANNMHLGETVAAEAAAGRVADPVIVLPLVPTRAMDTECLDGAGGQPRMETWISQDVPNWVTQHLRVQTGRGSWATLGLSAGAYCAVMVTMLHPDRFSAAISLGGYYKPSLDQSSVSRLGSSGASRYDLVQLAKTHPPPVALWVQTSAADPVSYATTEELLRAARAPISITADVLNNAGHRLGVWAPLVPLTLRWLGSSIPGFGPRNARAAA